MKKESRWKEMEGEGEQVGKKGGWEVEKEKIRWKTEMEKENMEKENTERKRN